MSDAALPSAAPLDLDALPTWFCNKCGKVGESATRLNAEKQHAIRSPRCDYSPSWNWKPPADPPSAAPLDLDALERLATETRDAWIAFSTAPHTAAGNDARVDYLAFREDFKSACSPDVILALVAAARQGEEDTTLTAVRAWFDAWADWPTAMTRDEAARLPEWDAMIDALGYDRDERRSAARAAAQQEEVSR